MVATDFSLSSVAALHVAARLAQALEAKVTILHVFEYGVRHAYKAPVDWMVGEIRKDVVKEFGEIERTLVAGVERYLLGSTAEEVLRVRRVSSGMARCLGQALELRAAAKTVQELRLRNVDRPIGHHHSLPGKCAWFCSKVWVHVQMEVISVVVSFAAGCSSVYAVPGISSSDTSVQISFSSSCCFSSE